MKLLTGRDVAFAYFNAPSRQSLVETEDKHNVAHNTYSMTGIGT
jgi:hypothetical protein